MDELITRMFLDHVLLRRPSLNGIVVEIGSRAIAERAWDLINAHPPGVEPLLISSRAMRDEWTN